MAKTTRKQETHIQREERLAEAAELIDREEQDEIKSLGRSVYSRLERIESVVRQVKAARMAKELSLSEVAERSRFDKAQLSKLESQRLPNPTIETLMGYAEAVGVDLLVTVADRNEQQAA